MAYTVRLTQGGSTLVDFADGTNFAFVDYECDALPKRGKWAQDELLTDILGASADATRQNWITLKRALLNAEENLQAWERGAGYTPIFFEFKGEGVTNALQSEAWGVDEIERMNWVDTLILNNLLPEIPLALKRRPYFEESALTTLVNGSTVSNNLAAISIAAGDTRGDLPFPIYLECNPGASSNDLLVAAIKVQNTPSNFIAKFEADDGTFTGYTFTRGTGCAQLADANLSNSAGTRVTFPNTSEEMRGRWKITSNLDAFKGYFHAYLRARDNAGTPTAMWRARPELVNGSTVVAYGDWGAPKRKVGAVGGTTTLPLIDLGILNLNLATDHVCIAVHGSTTNTGATGDFDELILVPANEVLVPHAGSRGFGAATFPVVMAAGARGVIDANDRLTNGYMVDGSGNVLFKRSAFAGAPLFGKPGVDQILYVFTAVAANGNHTHGVNNTITAKARFRYSAARGS